MRLVYFWVIFLSSWINVFFRWKDRIEISWNSLILWKFESSHEQSWISEEKGQKHKCYHDWETVINVCGYRWRWSASKSANNNIFAEFDRTRKLILQSLCWILWRERQNLVRNSFKLPVRNKKKLKKKNTHIHTNKQRNKNRSWWLSRGISRTEEWLWSNIFQWEIDRKMLSFNVRFLSKHQRFLNVFY